MAAAPSKPKLTAEDIAARQERDARIARNRAMLAADEARRRRQSSRSSLLSAGGERGSVLGVAG